MAIYALKLPRMGESIEEATVTSWLKEVGDTVEADESIVEVATDKVDTEVPTDFGGVIKEILSTKTMVKVGGHWLILKQTKFQQANQMKLMK